MKDTQHNDAGKLEMAKTLSIKGQNPLLDMQVSTLCACGLVRAGSAALNRVRYVKTWKHYPCE